MYPKEYTYTIVEDANGFWALLRDKYWTNTYPDGREEKENIVKYYQGFVNAERAVKAKLRR